MQRKAKGTKLLRGSLISQQGGPRGAPRRPQHFHSDSAPGGDRALLSTSPHACFVGSKQIGVGWMNLSRSRRGGSVYKENTKIPHSM